MRYSQLGFTLIELMIVVAIVGVLASIALPRYQVYVVKSQLARVMSETGTLKSLIESCLNNGKLTIGTGISECDPEAVGSSLIVGASQTGATLKANHGVPQVSILAGGAATLTATFGNSAAPIITSETLTWSRASSGVWTCTTTVAISEVVPAGCK